jgi:hypothetical protein
MWSRTSRYILAFSISASAFGLFVALMVAFNPQTYNTDLFWRKPLIGLVFGLICILGIFAALFPKQCSGTSHFPRKDEDLVSHRINGTSHHPSCNEYSTHLIRVRSFALCAACSGLFVGALIALAGTALYFFNVWHTMETGLSIVLIGEAAIILGFFQFKSEGFVRSAMNASFVVGAFLILAGIDGLTESVLIDLFMLLSIVSWILTRIQLSQWDHVRICNHCKSPCGI